MSEPTTSTAKQIAKGVAERLATHFESRAAVRTLWHPSFASKEELKETLIYTRPGRRSRRPTGRIDGVREVDIEVAVIRHLPKPEGDEGSFSESEIDALDLLSEEVFDLFVRVDEDIQPPPIGLLSEVPFCGYLPREVDQPTTFENALMEGYRLFLSVNNVTYQRME